MTLIEIFDRFVPENVAGALCLRPDKLILLGEEAPVSAFAPRCQAFLRAQGLPTRVHTCPMCMEQIETIVETVAQILRQETSCTIEIAGGDMRIVMALGVVLAGLDPAQRENIRVLRFDLENQQILDLGSQKITPMPVQLSVEQMLLLQGATLHPATHQPDAGDTAADLDGLWQLVCQDPRAWNRNISSLIELESRADSKMQVFLPLQALRGSISDFENKLTRVRGLLTQLHSCGAIVDQSGTDWLEYTYTSPLMRMCTMKAGNALETKCLLQARQMTMDGKPYFHDCRMGVHIDWDGQVFDTPQIPETRNEVDLLLMHGMTPLFVSCKNGDIGEAELYKLNTVATKFGGPYARKMLICTALGAAGALQKRAEDMDILLVPNAASLTQQGWRDLWLQAMQPVSAAKRNER